MTQQQTFLTNYTNPEKDTYGNAYQSAKDAGYSDSYAKNITHLNPNWLSEFIGNSGVLEQAKRNIQEWVNSEDYNFLPFKFKATEMVLKMAQAEADKEGDFLDKILNKSSVDNFLFLKLQKIAEKHRIQIPTPNLLLSQDEVGEIESFFDKWEKVAEEKFTKENTQNTVQTINLIPEVDPV